jgi:virginiamycin A acetyltransferase
MPDPEVFSHEGDSRSKLGAIGLALQARKGKTVKACAKSAADGLALLMMLPAFMCFRLGAWAMGAERAFPGWSQAISLIPGLAGTYMRRAFYRLVLPRCDPGCCLGFGTVFARPTAEVGRNVYVGAYCCLGTVTLEDDVLISSHVSIPSGGKQHGIDRLDLPIREQPGTWARVTIGRDSWIGDRAVVLANVGRHCVIGAGSVVTKPIPDYAVAVGVPARVVHFRNDDHRIDQDLESQNVLGTAGPA